MNRRIIFFIMVLKSCIVLSSPVIQVRTSHYDFKTIYENTNAIVSFKIKNIGSDTLIISKIYTTCSCTTYKCNNNTIAPNQEINLVIRYHAVFLGAFKESIIICSNASQKPLFLKIRGKVKKRTL